MTKTRVFIVDDSALMREILSQILAQAPDLEIAGTAADPIRARELLKTARADVMTLDVEMPRMDGLTFLETLMAEQPMPVVMVSSLTEKGSDLALRALELGAVDIVEKPKLDIKSGTMELAAEIVSKVRAAARARVRPRSKFAVMKGASPSPSPSSSSPSSFRTTDRIVAVGASTGGTEALAEFIRGLPPASPAVLIVQHMPPRFTGAFAKRLDGLGNIRVKEARSGDPLLQGHALLAPGDQHMRLQRSGGKYVVQVSGDAPVNLHRPSVDVLFESCARAAGRAAIGVILTGMGADGADGMLSLRRAGAATIAQDEATCVVFGMPKEAIARGGAAEVLPLERIAAAVLRAAH